MKTEYFKSDILGSGYTVAELDSGLKVYICEKKEFNSVYAAYGTKYGSIDSSFTVNGKQISVPDGIAHFLEHKLFESEDGDAFSKYAATELMQMLLLPLTAPVIYFPVPIAFMKI